ncbi:MAG: DUF3604 domain-containing protein, partial [Jiangellaceae bacterium]
MRAVVEGATLGAGDTLEFGVIAGSDNLHGQPGRGELGLTGFWAPELAREAIYGALTGRRTYATTDARILLDFTLNGAPMGATAESDGSNALNIRAHGTGAIESVELMVGDPASGRFGVAKRWTPDAADFVIEWEGATPSRIRRSTTYAYARLCPIAGGSRWHGRARPGRGGASHDPGRAAHRP